MSLLAKIKKRINLNRILIKETIRSCEGLIKSQLPVYVGSTKMKGTGKNILLLKSDTEVFLRTLTPRDTPGALATNNPFGGFTIFINEACEQLPRTAMEGVLAHELAHIQLGHLDQPLEVLKVNLQRRFLKGIVKKVPRPETEADMLAVTSGHREGLIMALTEIESKMKLLGLNTEELTKRIGILTEKKNHQEEGERQ